MSHQSMAVSDVQGLNKLLKSARSDDKEALPEAAKQFEALFLQTMLKQMRASQHVLDEDSPFRSQSQETFQEMLDGQFAMEIGSGKGVGLAQMMIQQLSGKADVVDNNEIKPLAETSATASVEANSETISDKVINFVKEIKPYAEQAASVLGVDGKMLIAQAALETGWGLFTAKDDKGNSSFNLFNIKADNSQDPSVKIKTTEFLADKPIKLNQYFKQYGNVAESFDDFVNLMTTSKRYQQALEHQGNSEQFIQGLQQAGYATDPAYADKILQIYRDPKLQAAMERVAQIMRQGDES